MLSDDGVKRLVRSESIWVWNSQPFLELTIYKKSTHFMSLFALVHTPKKVETIVPTKCEYLHLLLKCEQLFALQFCARMEPLYIIWTFWRRLREVSFHCTKNILQVCFCASFSSSELLYQRKQTIRGWDLRAIGLVGSDVVELKLVNGRNRVVKPNVATTSEGPLWSRYSGEFLIC